MIMLQVYIITQKPLALLYMNGEKIEREIKETILFTIAVKQIAYLGANLHIERKKDAYMYIENYKTVMYDMKDETNRWRIIPG